MNDRLEIAARIATGVFANSATKVNEEWDSEKDLADEVLTIADALIARELETRPKACKHGRMIAREEVAGDVRVCLDCGAEVP